MLINLEKFKNNPYFLPHMKRKLIKQGLGGVTLFLPIKWVRENRLNPGDEIELSEVTDGLLVSRGEFKEEKKEISITLTFEDEPSIRFRLNDLYRMGYDRITINYSSKDQIKQIDRIVTSRLLGFEKVHDDDKIVIIESITEPSGEKESILLRRMFLLIKESFQVVNKGLKSNDPAFLEELSDLSLKVDLYDNFNKRNIFKQRMINAQVNLYWSLYTHLMLIQHSLSHLLEELLKLKKFKLSTKNLSYLKDIEAYFDEVYEAFFKKDLAAIQRTNLQLNEVLYQRIQPSLLNSKGADSLFLYYLGELTRMIYLANVPIASILP